eukprot:TRINITY_DN8632_c0_g1_i1.p1 TRINITY_DN8632_c0_g1~~TRINITY_DN8632_c0_g1_i1.p1  ORF type:complete len:762 (+),score=245.81 TRINITY_DN8632_c0_g1_i1:78-2288(+)
MPQAAAPPAGEGPPPLRPLVGGGKEADLDALREFYFSSAKNYRAYQRRKVRAAGHSLQDADGRPYTAPAPNTAANGLDTPATRPAEAAATPGSDPIPPEVPPSQQVARGSASAAVASRKQAASQAEKDAAATRIQALQRGRHTREEMRKANEAAKPSPAYVAFLERQEELKATHLHLKQLLGALCDKLADARDEASEAVSKAQQTTKEAVASDSWDLTSSYQAADLARDAGLAVPLQELTKPSTKPRALELDQECAALERLAVTYGGTEQYCHLAVGLGDVLGRLRNAHESALAAPCDTAQLARVCDLLHAQVEMVCTEPTLEQQLSSYNGEIDTHTAKLESERAARDAALENGHADLAEGHHVTMVELYEHMQVAVVGKLETIERSKRELETWESVRVDYEARARKAAEAEREQQQELRAKLSTDLQRLTNTRARLAEVEKKVAATVARKGAQSDAALQGITGRTLACWARIAEAGRELQALEQERCAEVTRRIADRRQDELRRAEWIRLQQVCDVLERDLRFTIAGRDAHLQAAEHTAGAAAAGFAALDTEFKRRNQEHADTGLATHMQHLEVFRGLFLSLGEMAHRKDRGIADQDKRIQAAHIKLELAADTFNPEAKRFSDSKRELIGARQMLEGQKNVLRRRGAKALEKFEPSEQALRDCGVEFLHPLAEEKQKSLASRDRIVELKAYALSRKDGSAELQEEMDQLHQDAVDVAAATARRRRNSGGWEVRNV